VRTWARGVDPTLFHPGRRDLSWRLAQGFAPDCPVIVFLGRIVMEKGLEAFADTIGRLRAAGLGPQVLVIGDGPARGWFETRLPDGVFTGFLSGETLASALASGDIFFNPSTTETFGNVNLEAMACGLAMVCADAPNTRALLHHGKDALLCAHDQRTSYAEALATLLVDARERRRLAAEALDRSAAYRWTNILDEVFEVYAEALDRHAARTPTWRVPSPARSRPGGYVEPQPNGLPVL
jgi:glycosyltransferase involved in cell wall biosynthesis